MASRYRRQTQETEMIEETLREKGFADTTAYRYNSASIRVRIIDKRFAKKSWTKREKMVLPTIRSLPEEIQLDIIFLLMLAPDEAEESPMNMEFENPDRSRR